MALHAKQADQNHNRDRQYEGSQHRRGHVQAFDGAQHRNGRCYRPVAVEQTGAEQTQEHQPVTHLTRFAAPGIEQCHQGDDAALPLIIGAQYKGQILDRYHQHQRPQNQRQHSQQIGPVEHRRAGTAEAFAQGVERTGTDVAEHHTQCRHQGLAIHRMPRVRYGSVVCHSRRPFSLYPIPRTDRDMTQAA